MASRYGGKIVTDGLVLCLDAHDAKSYAGEPTTNVLQYPESINSGPTQESWSGTITQNAVIAPDGTLTATKIEATSGYVYERLYINTSYNGVSFGVGDTITYSVWIKMLDGTQTSSNGPYIWNYNSPTYGIVARDLSGLGPDWKLYKMTYTIQSHQTNFSISYSASNGGVTGTYAIWHPQLEVKSYNTSYIKTSRPAITSFLIHGNVGSGTTFEDSSPNKITVSNQNSVSHGGTSNFGGSAIQFSSSSSQQLTSASTDVINFGTGDWTIEFWFNMTSGSTARMHALSCGSGNTNNIDFNFNDGNAFWLYWNSGGTPNIIFGNDGDYGDGNWHHLMATRASGMVRVWVDGVHKGSNNYSSSTSMGQTASIYVGGKNGVYWDGFLDEIRIIKGTALWSGSGNFAVPTERFKNGAWLDRSGNENNGNLLNGLSTGAGHYRDGQVIMPVANSYLEFDGTNDYINLPSETNFISGNQVTVEAWVTTDVTGSYKKIFITAENNGTANVTGVFLSLGNSTSTGVYFGVYNTSNTYAIANHGSYLSTGTWTHLTGTYDGSNVKLYVNGSLSSSTSQTGNIRTGSNGIGRISGYMSGGEIWDGKIASLKVYTKALTAAEVLSNYNTTKGRFS